MAAHGESRPEPEGQQGPPPGPPQWPHGHWPQSQWRQGQWSQGPWPGQPYQQPGWAAERTGVSREDTEALLAARRELGQDYEPALVDSFLERVDRSIDARVQARVDAHMAAQRKPTAGPVTVPIVSLVFAIPLSAIAGGMTGFRGLILVWSAVVLINLAYAIRRPR